jgi:chorismate mutase/prephenate dehydratase
MSAVNKEAQAMLAPLRKEIDDLDQKLLELVQRRARAAIELGKLKKKNNLPIMDLVREKQIMSRLAGSIQPGDGLSIEAASSVFNEIIKACRAAQAPTKVTFLGPAGTFSHAAALEQFGKLAFFMPADDLSQVFQTADGGEADFALVPFENTTEGIVGQTLDLLTQTTLRAQAMLNLKVNLSLMSTPGTSPR